MKLYSNNENYKLYQGNMLDMLEVIEPNSIDSIITDPPYGLTSITKRFGKENSAECQYGKDGSFARLSKGFMGKEWDGSGIEYNIDTWRKCYEVLKPGGYLLAFGGSRTFHRIACAIEDAGFEIRDTIMWLYGSGFPKSMDISKQLDKRNGKQNEDFTKFGNYVKQCREAKGFSKNDIDKMMGTNTAYAWWEGRNYLGDFIVQLPDKDNYYKLKEILDMNNDFDYLIEWQEAEREIIGKKESGCFNNQEKDRYTIGSSKSLEVDITIPSTDLAKQWQGWGTALKPSFEPIIVARKPFKGSLVDNVIEYGVGGINIDECRVEMSKNDKQEYYDKQKSFNNMENQVCGDNVKFNVSPLQSLEERTKNMNLGRFPANTILTYDKTDFNEVCGGFPNTKSAKNGIRQSDSENVNCYGKGIGIKAGMNNGEYGDSGSASRYFMNCKYTGKDEEIWKQLLVNNVERNLEILKATKDNIAQMSVRTLLKELKDHYAKYVGNQLDLIETSIVQDIVKMLTWDFKIGTSQVIQDFIINSKKCIQFLNLVQFVEKMDNIDTTQTTQNLLKLFGYVKVVITNYIQGNIEYDQKRYIYTPKASKKDRDEGLEDFIPTTDKAKGNGLDKICEFCGISQLTPELCCCETKSWITKPKKNTHPTVKPTDLMQYLVRLVSPNGATILDPFNGSGSTGKAVMYENKEKNKNYKYIGIELTEEYLPIAKARIEYVCNEKEIKEKEQIKKGKEENQLTIFDMLGDDINE